MIRRDEGSDWLLIPQIEHAHVAGDIAAAWGNDQVPAFPGSPELMAAVRHHDDGWREWDAAPRIDPQNGIPRSFLEMPMSIATEIWSRSIDMCSRITSAWQSAVDASGCLFRVPTSSAEVEGRVIDAVAGLNRAFTGNDVIQWISPTADPSSKVRANVFRTLMMLELAGWLRKVGDEDSLERYVCAFPHVPCSPLGGIAVSKHFCWLAEQALDTRSDDPDELKSINAFLDAQRNEQQEWRDVAKEFWQSAANELDAMLTRGFHAVQFFDRLSLWLCCAKRTEALVIDCPNGGTFRLAPESPERISVKPFPFTRDTGRSLEVTVTAKRVPARKYADDDDLLNALHDSKSERLAWTLV